MVPAERFLLFWTCCSAGVMPGEHSGRAWRARAHVVAGRWCFDAASGWLWHLPQYWTLGRGRCPSHPGILPVARRASCSAGVMPAEHSVRRLARRTQVIVEGWCFDAASGWLWHLPQYWTLGRGRCPSHPGILPAHLRQSGRCRFLSLCDPSGRRDGAPTPASMRAHARRRQRRTAGVLPAELHMTDRSRGGHKCTSATLERQSASARAQALTCTWV
jgi:hypothetical protein